MRQVIITLHHFLGQRSLGRLLWGSALVIAGLLIGFIAVLRPDLARSGQDGLAALFGWLSMSSPVTLPLISMAVLLAIGSGLIAVTLPEKRQLSLEIAAPEQLGVSTKDADTAFSAVNTLNGMAPVVVYIDQENQPIPEEELPFFLQILDDYIHSKFGQVRTDRYLVTDLRQFMQVGTDSYAIAWWRAGFNVIDAPHVSIDIPPVDNMVDIILMNHAYHRAIVAPVKHDFIFITGDSDFVPIFQEIRRLGHRIHVMVKEDRPKITNKQIAQVLGYVPFIFGPVLQASMKKPTIPQDRLYPPIPLKPNLVKAQTRTTPGPTGLLEKMIDETLKILSDPVEPGKNVHVEQFSRISNLGSNNILKVIGFDKKHRVDDWLLILQTLGIVRMEGKIAVRAEGTRDEAVRTLLAVLHELVMHINDAQVITYADLLDLAVSTPGTPSEQFLNRLLLSTSKENVVRLVKDLVYLARYLKLVKFTEAGATIRSSAYRAPAFPDTQQETAPHLSDELAQPPPADLTPPADAETNE